jgi:hypothetical protein
MTENEWLECEDPYELLRSLSRDSTLTISALPSHRQLRLFAVSCAKLLAAEFVDGRTRIAIEYAEQSVDRNQMEAARLLREIRSMCSTETYGSDSIEGFLALVMGDIDALHAASEAARIADRWMTRDYANHSRTQKTQLRHQFHDIFGNPFRRVAFDPNWRTATAVGLAQTMYDARDFNAMPILADALQDAGCEDAAILGHCRDANGVHVRGCWVVDLVLGKS